MAKKTSYFKFILTVFLAIGVSIFNILIPIVSKNMINTAVYNKTLPISGDVITLLLLIIAVIAFEYFRKVAHADYISISLNNLRSTLLKLYYQKDNQAIIKMSSQDYISVFNNDINTIANDYYGLSIDIIMSVFSIFLYFFALIRINLVIAIIAISANIISLLIPLMMKKQLYEARQNHLDSLKTFNNKLGDAIIGHLTIRLFRLKKAIIELVTVYSEKNRSMYMDYKKKTAMVEVIVGLFAFLSLFAILSSGAFYVSQGILTIGELFAAIQISDLLVMPIISVSSDTASFIAARKVKIKTLSEFEENANKQTNEVTNIAFNHSIRLHNVSVIKNGKTILAIKNLQIEKNKKYLVLGDNGSGKSTLLNLLTGLEKNYNGDILVDQQKMPSAFNPLNCAYATQMAYLFNDSLLNNITLNREYDKKKLDSILELLGIKQLIKEKGELVYSENNEQLSGGEKQKIALARLLLLNKDIILLDEATSAMDKQSTIRLEKALLANKNISLLYVAHKVHSETIDNFDEIIKL